MKYIVILGKGPSSKPLKKSPKYDIATINNSIWLAPNPTYSFFNDLESFEQMTDEDFKKVTDLIVPSYLHTQSNPRFNNKSTDFHFYRLSEFFPERFNHINIYPYELHPNDNSRPEELERIKKYPTQIPPKLPEWPGSTGQTATMWLSMFKNYSDIIMMGCDPEGGYNPVFEKNSPHYMGSINTPSFGGNSTAAQPRGYDLDFAQSLKWAKHYGVNLRHISEVPKEEQKELGLL